MEKTMKKRKKNDKGSAGAGGLMMGMRGGFKKAAKSLTGDNQKKKSGPMDWVLTVLTVLLAAYVIYKFFLR